MMPWRLAYWPVRIEARLGEQSGVVWNAALNIAPSWRDAVDVRRLHVGMAADAELVEPEIVDQDDDQVGFRRHGSLPWQCLSRVAAASPDPRSVPSHRERGGSPIAPEDVPKRVHRQVALGPIGGGVGESGMQVVFKDAPASADLVSKKGDGHRTRQGPGRRTESRRAEGRRLRRRDGRPPAGDLGQRVLRQEPPPARLRQPAQGAAHHRQGSGRQLARRLRGSRHPARHLVTLEVASSNGTRRRRPARRPASGSRSSTTAPASSASRSR